MLFASCPADKRECWNVPVGRTKPWNSTQNNRLLGVNSKHLTFFFFFAWKMFWRRFFGGVSIQFEFGKIYFLCLCIVLWRLICRHKQYRTASPSLTLGYGRKNPGPTAAGGGGGGGARGCSEHTTNLDAPVWNVQNIKHKHTDQPAKILTPCRSHVLPLLNHRGDGHN